MIVVVLQVVALVMLGSATKLKTARKINGTNFDGTGDVTTSQWGTARTLALTGAVSGSISVDGSGNVTITTKQANIAILTGNITLSNGEGNTTVNYPSGFTISNCIVLAVSCARSASNNPTEYYTVSGTTVLGAYLQSSNVKLQATSLAGIGPSATVKYQVVLMKVS